MMCRVVPSGGLDSSLVTAAAAEVSSQPIKILTIGVSGSAMEETVHADWIARAFSTEHKVLPIEAPSLDVLDYLEPFIDEPIADSSILPSSLVRRLTRQYVTVAPGGDGGDELYNGYWHYQNALRDQARPGWMPTPELHLAGQLAATLPAGTLWRNRIASLRSGPGQSSLWGAPYFDLTLRRCLLTPEVLAELGDTLDAPEQRSLALYWQVRDPVDA